MKETKHYGFIKAPVAGTVNRFAKSLVCMLPNM